jgi:hypothetical protein
MCSLVADAKGPLLRKIGVALSANPVPPPYTSHLYRVGMGCHSLKPHMGLRPTPGGGHCAEETGQTALGFGGFAGFAGFAGFLGEH